MTLRAAVTICQPYPELILLGEKPIENRTWSTPFRGTFAIHAGKSRDWLTPDDERRFPTLTYGAIVGVATLVECLRLTADRAWPDRYEPLRHHQHANGPWCWILTDVRRLERPIPWKGALGFWTLPPEIRAAVLEQVA